MGNRAIITTEDNFNNNGIGVYIHWNGGRDSVSAFLKYCELKGYRTPDTDCYGWARLCQVISNFFGGSTSIGIDTLDNLPSGDFCDNGIYIIRGWEIVDRKCFDDCEEQDEYSLVEMLEAIDESMPISEQLGAFIKAEEIPISDVRVGDAVYIRDWDDKISTVIVAGFGDDRVVNGLHTKGLPFAHIVSNSMDNPNNYIKESTVRLFRRGMA